MLKGLDARTPLFDFANILWEELVIKLFDKIIFKNNNF